MERPAFDIGLLVPLKEEFRYVLQVVPQLESLSHEGTYFYRLDFGAITAVCCLVDQMGPIPALQAATRLLGFADIKLVVLLGIGGALDDDIAIGDVVIATEVNEFQANAKAESTDQGYEIRRSGRHWPLDFKLREALSHFEFSGAQAFGAWIEGSSRLYHSLEITDKEDVCPSRPSLHLGPIASGSTVAASSTFVAELKRVDRKFVAIDMEAAGVAPAAVERIHPLPWLVVRGISDRSNETKKSLDQRSRGAWRGYCVRNATSLLRHLLTWEGFLNAAGLSASKPGPDRKELAGQLAIELRATIGGPWIVGVAFGVYSHGPHVRKAEPVVAMDLSRLSVLDPRVARAVDAAKLQKDELLAHGDVELAGNGFGRLVTAFRSELKSEEADLLLRDFDRVVVEILCPTSQDEQVESLLLESNRLEEEVGPSAVVELLKGATRLPRLRERYVDALASIANWSELTTVIDQCDATQLSRLELEHGLFALAKLGLFERARQMMSVHQAKYDDNAARLLRREVSRELERLEADTSGGQA